MTVAPLLKKSPAPESFALDVAPSVLGKVWAFPAIDERAAAQIAQGFGLPDIVARLLAARGVAFDAVDGFLNPQLKTQLPDPDRLKDMGAAAARIADALINNEKVAVFGDYDVDGATSSALLARFFRDLGQEIAIYIPDRIAEGYGPNAPALKKLVEAGARLVITVDCGTTAFDVLESVQGADVVVLDHHRAEPKLPKALAVVNPNRLDDDSGLGHLAAVGVTFLTIIAVNRILRARGFYATRNEPRLLNGLDLVALGTVCDVVPLTDVNRALVAQGLRVMALRQNTGLAALADVAGLDAQPTAFHAGFLLGPRVNAGGRVGEASLGARLLATDDSIEARAIAQQLHIYNAERRALENAVLDEAMLLAEAAVAAGDPVLLIAGDGWHPGVIGIVAARLKEKYSRPACVIAFDENGIGKASARSVAGVDLGGAVLAAHQAGLLINGGGHAMAAGFTVARDALPAFAAYIKDHVSRQQGGVIPVPVLRVDAVLSLPSLNLSLAGMINRLAPYGAGHAEPRFALAGVRVVKPRVVGENHVSCFLQDSSGGASLKGIAFRALDTALGETLLRAGSLPLHVAGHVSVNTWQGRESVDFQIVDVAHAN